MGTDDFDLELELDPDLDESTRIVTRGATPSVFEDVTRVVTTGSERDDATRVVTRRAAAAVPPAPAPPVAAPAVAERYFPVPATGPELDESTRIVRHPSAAAEADDDDATRIVRRAPAVSTTADPTPAVAAPVVPASPPTPAVAAPASEQEASGEGDDATRIVRRPVLDAEAVDDSTRIVRRAASAAPIEGVGAVSAAAGSGPDPSVGEDTRAIVRTGASAPTVAATPQPPATVPTASAVPTPPQREVYTPRPAPEQLPLQRTQVEASSRPPAVAESAGAQTRRRLVIALSAVAGIAVLGAVIAAAVVLIAAL